MSEGRGVGRPPRTVVSESLCECGVGVGAVAVPRAMSGLRVEAWETYA